ncbi:MAG: nuclear transport factor 2 family protein [Chthoniobacterales bacterium]
MHKAISFLLLVSLAFVASAATNDETQIWNLEKSYWEYVKANDLEKYRALWHERFLGWPSSSSSPARKDHITDWITKNTSEGVKLGSYEMEQVAVQITGDNAAVHYRIKMTWSGPKPTDSKTETLRIHHTWLRVGDTWQILAGMSAPVNDEGK